MPAVNQVELHPRLRRPSCAPSTPSTASRPRRGARWAGASGLLDDPVLAGIAGSTAGRPAQVVLRWHLQLGNVVIPKSVTPARIGENIDVFDFELAGDDMAAIGALDRGSRAWARPRHLQLSRTGQRGRVPPVADVPSCSRESVQIGPRM